MEGLRYRTGQIVTFSSFKTTYRLLFSAIRSRSLDRNRPFSIIINRKYRRIPDFRLEERSGGWGGSTTVFFFEQIIPFQQLPSTLHHIHHSPAIILFLPSSSRSSIRTILIQDGLESPQHSDYKRFGQGPGLGGGGAPVTIVIRDL